MITLQSQKDSLVSRLRHILSSHLELLDLLEMDEKEISKLKDRTNKIFSGSKDEFKGSKLNTKPVIAQKKDDIVPENPEIKKDQIKESNIFKNIFGESLDLDG